MGQNKNITYLTQFIIFERFTNAYLEKVKKENKTADPKVLVIKELTGHLVRHYASTLHNVSKTQKQKVINTTQIVEKMLQEFPEILGTKELPIIFMNFLADQALRFVKNKKIVSIWQQILKVSNDLNLSGKKQQELLTPISKIFTFIESLIEAQFGVA